MNFGSEDEQELEQTKDSEELNSQRKQIDEKISEKSSLYREVLEIIERLKKKSPQFNMDGERNIWIMKPAGSSRGRGISLQKNLHSIIRLCQKGRMQFVIQKYIENTMIIKNRKFDIRQWILVTCWNPLTIWMFAEPYIRFPAADFSYA